MTNIITRRGFFKSGAAAFLAASQPVWAEPIFPERLGSPLLARAHATLMRHRDRFTHLDRIGITDFSRPSSDPRLFVVDMIDGRTSAFLVAHGRGSDPTHTGWLKRFSNDPGSFASSDGAYATGNFYTGGHGHSMRLVGLDPGNSNAEARDIVVHAAQYVSPEIAQRSGKIGRSEGCFAVSNVNLHEVLAQLGPGRLLYADKA